MEMIAPSELRHLITIEVRGASTRDGYGEKAKVWETFANTRANVEPLSAGNQPIAKSFKGTVSHQIKIRYRPGVLTTMRLNFKGRFFSIDGITNTEERNIELVLYCTEIAPTAGGAP